MSAEAVSDNSFVHSSGGVGGIVRGLRLVVCATFEFGTWNVLNFARCCRPRSV